MNNIKILTENRIEYNGEVLSVPHHIAVIPDGNRRWAKERGLPAISGHKEGVEALKLFIENSSKLGIKYVTFYAFSTENWKRSSAEIDGLMKLLASQLKNFDSIIGKNINNIRIIVIGNKSALSKSLQNSITTIEKRTENNTGITVFIAINYGGRDEILNATKNLFLDIEKGILSNSDLDEEIFSKYMYTGIAPDPDLLIRTSGEERISNFLLWQLAYTEFYFDNCYWPDFSSECLINAVRAYSKRKRRYGGS